MQRTDHGPFWSRASSSEAGLGLLGVIVVLAVVALITCLAVPRFFAQPEVTLDNACLVLVRDIHTAQNRATWSATDIMIAFDEDGGGYRMIDRTGRPVERLGALGGHDRRYEEEGVFAGVRIAEIDAGADRALCFDHRKKNWEGGEVELTFAGESRIVRVTPRSGEVVILGLKRPWTDRDYQQRGPSEP